MARCGRTTLALALALTAAPARAGATSPPCSHLAVTTGAVFCAYTAGESVRVARGTTSGRSWGAPVVAYRAPDRVAISAIVASPRYANDHALFVVTTEGLLYSTDGGLHFALVAPGEGVAASSVTAFMDGVSGLGEPRPALALAPPAVVGAQVFTDGLGERTVAGATMWNARFVVADDYPSSRRAHVLATVPGATAAGTAAEPGGVYAFSCAGDFACPVRAAYLGPGVLTDGGVLPGTDQSWVQVSNFVDPPTSWRTRDAGATWGRWSSLERLLVSLDSDPGIRITAAPDAPNRLFLHVTLAPSAAGRRPAYQLFRSDDDGTTWRRVAFGWRAGQRATSPGTLPWTGDTGGTRGPHVVAGPKGRMYAAGVRVPGRTSPAFVCSADAGRTWRVAC